jgi:tRNA(Leu) C34 or U34 (ribose-2'-O)-methylase TrmL
MRRIVLYQPIYSVKEVQRLCVCFEVQLYVIGNTNIKNVIKIPTFHDFIEKFKDSRKILMTPHTDTFINNFSFLPKDVICFGRETNGIELEYMRYFDHFLAIKMPENCISLSLDVSVAITLSYLS